MNKLSVSIACLLLVSGCASSVKTVPPKIKSTNESYPDLGVIVKATVGQALLMSEDKVLVERHVIADNNSLPFMLGTINVASGDFLSEAVVKGKKALCTDEKSYYDPTVRGPIAISCFIDSDEDGYFESVLASPGAIFFEKKIDSPINYLKRSFFSNLHPSNKTELVYNGVSNGQLSLTYREFTKGKLNSDSVQNVTYDISTLPTKISYLAVDFEIYSVGNDGIEYKILKWNE